MRIGLRALGQVTAAICAVFALLGADRASAQGVAEFYAGKTMDMVIGYPTGGSNDLFARIVAQHLGKHIPGQPRIVPKNMPGAGSLLAANHLFNVAPKDGTVLGAVSQGMPLQARLNPASVKFDPSKFNWIGRVSPSSNVTMVWHTSKAMNFDYALKNEIVLGATGAGSTVALYPLVMNEILKTKFKLIMGYKGSADAMLAMERGEVEGHSTTWEAVKAVHPDWIKEKKVRFLVQHGLSRNPEIPDVLTSVELTQNPEDKAVMRVIMSAAEIGKSYFTAPGVPAERVEALRRAFDAMVKDPEFIAALEKIGGDVDALKGEDVQKLVQELDEVPPPLLKRVGEIYKEQ
jgi:tripartite-type tricarboxylate transporter receptor subunit TctC